MILAEIEELMMLVQELLGSINVLTTTEDIPLMEVQVTVQLPNPVVETQTEKMKGFNTCVPL